MSRKRDPGSRRPHPAYPAGGGGEEQYFSSPAAAGEAGWGCRSRYPLRQGAWALVIVVALAEMAAPAHSMWDRVRWNSTVAEVVASRRGAIVRNEDRASRRVIVDQFPLLLQGALSGARLVGGARVQAVFWFDPAGHLLSVTETTEASDGPSDGPCAAFEAGLAARYGPVDLVTVKGDERHLNWRDEKGHTRILFRRSDGECIADYRELRGPLDR